MEWNLARSAAVRVLPDRSPTSLGLRRFSVVWLAGLPSVPRRSTLPARSALAPDFCDSQINELLDDVATNLHT